MLLSPLVQAGALWDSQSPAVPRGVRSMEPFAIRGWSILLTFEKLITRGARPESAYRANAHLRSST